ncbi:hypothetical protein LCGC14_3146270, partial [marine sediment metagenome]
VRGRLPDQSAIAYRLRISSRKAEQVVEALIERGLLDRDGDALVPHNWDERQPDWDNKEGRLQARLEQGDFLEEHLEIELLRLLKAGQWEPFGQKIVRVERQARIGNSYIDLLAHQEDGAIVIELKRHRLTLSAENQVLSYFEMLKQAGQPVVAAVLLGAGLAGGYTPRPDCSHLHVITMSGDGRQAVVKGRVKLPPVDAVNLPQVAADCPEEERDKEKNRTEPEEAAAAATSPVLAALTTAYENDIAAITPTIADALKEWAERIPETEAGCRAILYAFREAAANNRRNWRYVEAILKRQEADGWPAEPGTEREAEASGGWWSEHKELHHRYNMAGKA